MVGWFALQMLNWLLGITLDAIKDLWGLLSETAFTTPDVTTLPQIQAISGKSLTVVNVAFILAIITAGITVMTHETVQIRYGVAETAPRLVVGWIAANFSMPICSQLTELANALTAALTGEDIASKDSFAHLQRVVTDAMTNSNSAALTLVIALLIAVLTGMLLVTWLVRLGVLIVLVGIAPVALACHATPYTEGAARLWWRSLLAVLGTVLLQAVALHTALKIFLDPNVNLPALGIPNDPAGELNLFIVACLLWVTVKIPGMMRRYVTRGGGQHNVAGLIVRMVFVQQLTSMLRMPFRGRGGVGRAAAAGGAGGVAGRAAGRTAAGQPSAANTVIGYWRPRLPRPTPSTTRTTAAGTGAAPVATPGPGSERSPSRPSVPAGVNPATAMPRTRPAWQAARAAGPASGAPPAPVTPPAAPRIPPGSTPATAMPRSRPAWQTPPAGPPPRPRIPPGVNPGNAMPRRRPNRP